MKRASGAISAAMGAYALSYGRPKRVTSSAAANRVINAVWLLVGLGDPSGDGRFHRRGRGYLLAHSGAHRRFRRGLALQRRFYCGTTQA